jgi:hypothetical protein
MTLWDLWDSQQVDISRIPKCHGFREITLHGFEMEIRKILQGLPFVEIFEFDIKNISFGFYFFNKVLSLKLVGL